MNVITNVTTMAKNTINTSFLLRQMTLLVIINSFFGGAFFLQAAHAYRAGILTNRQNAYDVCPGICARHNSWTGEWGCRQKQRVDLTKGEYFYFPYECFCVCYR